MSSISDQRKQLSVRSPTLSQCDEPQPRALRGAVFSDHHGSWSAGAIRRL